MKFLFIEGDRYPIEPLARTSASLDSLVDVVVENQADEECVQPFEDRLFPVRSDPSRVK
jgi:hypothetical protein